VSIEERGYSEVNEHHSFATATWHEDNPKSHELGLNLIIKLFDPRWDNFPYLWSCCRVIGNGCGSPTCRTAIEQIPGPVQFLEGAGPLARPASRQGWQEVVSEVAQAS